MNGATTMLRLAESSMVHVPYNVGSPSHNLVYNLISLWLYPPSTIVNPFINQLSYLGGLHCSYVTNCQRVASCFKPHEKTLVFWGQSVGIALHCHVWLPEGLLRWQPHLRTFPSPVKTPKSVWKKVPKVSSQTSSKKQDGPMVQWHLSVRRMLERAAGNLLVLMGEVLETEKQRQRVGFREKGGPSHAKDM